MRFDLSVYFFAVYLLIVMSGLSRAEYRAITTFPSPEAGVDKFGKPLEVRHPEIDEVDLKACQAITENINAMERYHIHWECDFPISTISYLLSKPQWAEVLGEEKSKALDVISPNRKDKDGGNISVFGFPYNLDTIDGDEKIYIASYSGYVCKIGSTESRVGFWFSEKNKLNFINSDPVLFSSRMYFIEYNRDGENKNNFNVTTLKKRLSSSSTVKHLYRVCTVSPVAQKIL